MLGPRHADRRQLGDLVATEPTAGRALPNIEPTPAPTARIREVINDLIHLILGPQLAPHTRVPRLTASLASLTLPAINSFAFARASARR